MKAFFSSIRFKVFFVISVVLISFMVRAAWEEDSAGFIKKTVGVVVTPITTVTTNINNAFSDFFGGISDMFTMAEENTALKQEIIELNNKLVEMERLETENKQLREYLGIKENNEDFEIVTSLVVGRDSTERFFSFTIDRGSIHGVSVGDPVISSFGLIGVVAETALVNSTVHTILDPNVNVGVISVRNGEVGSTGGTATLSLENMLEVSYLPRDSEIIVNDIMVTSGIGGFFPKDLIVGQVKEVATESHGLSQYAVVEPLGDVRNVKEVMIITDFDGKHSNVLQEAESGEPAVE